MGRSRAGPSIRPVGEAIWVMPLHCAFPCGQAPVACTGTAIGAAGTSPRYGALTSLWSTDSSRRLRARSSHEGARNLLVGAGIAIALVMLLAARSGALAQYVAVWGLWLHGRSTSGAPLAGHAMLSWGRAGKILQFLGGLVAVLDLLDLNKLRERGSETRKCHDRNRAPLEILHKARKTLGLENRLVHTVISYWAKNGPGHWVLYSADTPGQSSSRWRAAQRVAGVLTSWRS